MDKKKSPCGQIIENLDDFKYWLTYMEKLSGQLRPRVRHELSNFINEALKLEHYDDDAVSYFVDAIDKLYNESVEKQIDRSLEGHNNFLEDSLDFRYSCEQRYGAQTAFNEVYNDLENHINHSLNPLVNYDKNFHEFKQQALNNLERAKKIKKDELSAQSAWDCLYRVRLNTLNNNEYFVIKLDKKRKSKGGSKSIYKPHKTQIIEIIKLALSPKGKGKISQKTARIKIRELLPVNPDPEKPEKVPMVSHAIYKSWLDEYNLKDDIFTEND
jgi:hypothetical protein